MSKLFSRLLGIPQRLRQAREEAGFSRAEMARRLALHYNTIVQYENGAREPSRSFLDSLQELTGVSLDWILTGREDADLTVPVYGTIPAGHAASPGDTTRELMRIQLPDGVSQKGAFGLLVKGDSMYPEIVERDIVIIAPNSSWNSGDIVCARLGGDEFTLKRIKVSDSGIILQPENPSYDPILVSQSDIESSVGEIEIVGPVYSVWRRY